MLCAWCLRCPPLGRPSAAGTHAGGPPAGDASPLAAARTAGKGFLPDPPPICFLILSLVEFQWWLDLWAGRTPFDP